MAHPTDLNTLLLGYLEDTLSDAEKKELIAFLGDPRNEKDFAAAVARLYEESGGRPSRYVEIEVERMIQQILHAPSAEAIVEPPSVNVHRIPLLGRRAFRYAAAVVAIVVAGYYMWPVKKNAQPEMPSVVKVSPLRHDADPAADKALLTLSDGRKVELQRNQAQTIVDGNLAVQNENGKLIYKNSRVVVYNTMTTPKGAQYRLTLADGTNVWLNAASSITFPTSFPGQVRRVEVTGEVYFEVAKNAAQPFVVKTYKDEIIVRGTHFNVNAYPDEAGVKTSLEEGSVQINKTVLKPGQAYLNNKVITTDLNQDIAWKNRIFNFNGYDLQAVMRQLSRWYNVQVVYERNIPSMKFYGKMDRDLRLSQVLSILEKSDVHFEIIGSTLNVKP